MNSKHTNHRDGNEIAAEYDEAICLFLIIFGYLTARMVAELIRPGDPAGIRTAQRRLKSLLKRRLVIQTRTDNGIPLYKLTQAGATYLRDLGHKNVPVRGTRDARVGNSFHRCLSNNFLIYQLAANCQYWTEYQVLQKQSPLDSIEFERTSMVPDALMDTGAETFWIEAENAVKSPERLARLARLADYMFGDYNGYSFDHQGEPFSVRGMIFICPTEARARAVARAFANPPRGSMVPERVLIIHAPMTKSLIWPSEIEKETAYEMAARLGYIDSDTDEDEPETEQSISDEIDAASDPDGSDGSS